MLPWLLCDYSDSKREMTLTRYRIIVFLISLLGLVVPIFGGRPVMVMIVSQALSSVLLPMTVGCILYLANRKDLMKEHSNKLGTNLILVAILLLSIFNSSTAIQGVFGQISELFAA